MFATRYHSVRALLLALALAVHTADGRGAADSTQPPAHTAQTRADAPGSDRDQFEGALLIAGIVGVGVALAWVCSRIGDTRSAL
jgi:hypothetical protein